MSKTNEKFLKYYIKNEDNKLTEEIKEFFNFDEFSDDILSEEIKPKKNLGSKIYLKYYEPIEKSDINLIKNVQFNNITIYKFGYLFPYVELIFIKIIYELIQKTNILLQDLIDYASEGGMFELLIIYHIISNKKFFNYKITNYITLKTIVPYSYSLKMYSYIQKKILFNAKKEDKVCCDINKIIHNNSHNNNKLIDLNNEGIFISQKMFNGKYYDCGILIPYNNNQNNRKKKFILILFQITIKKRGIQLLTIQEHEINYFFIKKYIENIYNIEIVEGYFYYILKSVNDKIIDINTYSKYKGMCLGFDVNKGFINKNLVLDEKSLITKNFSLFNEVNLLKNDINVNAIEKIKSLKNISPEKLDDNIFKILKNLIDNKNNNILQKCQFHVYSKNLDMTDSVKSLTDFFIFIKKK